MSNQAITWALETATPGPATKVLLIALANYANEHNESYPSIERLARETDQSPATVKRHLNKLVELGLITRSPRGDAHTGGRLSNLSKLAVQGRGRARWGGGGWGGRGGGLEVKSGGGLGSTVSRK